MTFYALPNRRALNDLRREMERVFANVMQELPDTPWAALRRERLPVNVIETDKAFLVESEIPGVAPEGVDISVVGRELTLKVERPDESGENTTYHRRERPVGTATRIIRLPSDIDADGVEADLKQGVLTIMVPKAKEAQPKKIRVATD
ncbi:MAG: Hsp20/alpha crystallin family protein [Planctomycetota bacterium]|nr:MAG: Hsp20/alpha crystallin family protein [Planctomycetota bacterium]